MEKKNESKVIINYYTINMERNSANSTSSKESYDFSSPKFNRKIQMKKLYKTNQALKVIKNATSFWENIVQK